MKIRINHWMLISIIVAVMIYVVLENLVGTIPECRTEAYTIWEVLKVGLCFVSAWILGFFSKWYKNF